ncbi:Hypothetical predicted protein [Cloeon dipterum]|uniref:Uncharacterized protein n=1 Tax=Cloeon dipterum TaxID=197152 RepID=A0A8S1DG13_9INSE|nr:Hypothetical predicted protein [Cloeon dipterum]
MHPRGGLGSTAPPGSGVCRSSASAAGWYGKMTPIGLLLGLLCCVGPTLQVLVVTAGSQEHPRSSTEPVPATPVVHENSSGVLTSPPAPHFVFELLLAWERKVVR